MNTETKMYYRAKELADYLGIGESTIWHKTKAGEFPKPTQVSPNVTVWNIAEVNEFMANKKGVNHEQG